MWTFCLIVLLLSLPVWNQSMLVLTDWKHQLICSQLEIKVDGLDFVSRDTCHQILDGNSALQKRKVETARWVLLACHLMGMCVFSHESLLALLFGATSRRGKPGPLFMLNNLSGFSLSFSTFSSVHGGGGESTGILLNILKSKSYVTLENLADNF